MLYLMKKLFNKSPALLLAICLLLGLTLPSAALARIPDQVEIKAADVLLSDIEECTTDSLAGQEKWGCVETKYQELLRMHLEDVNPSAHWCAAHSAWRRGDIALTYQRLNQIAAEFPNYTNLRLENADFISLKTWLSYLDTSYAPVKVRLPLKFYFSKPRPMFVGESSYALTFANRELASTRRFEGYLPIGQYTFGDEILVVTAEGYTLSQPEEEPGARVLRPRPTQDFLDVMALMGPGLRFDAPDGLGVIGPSLVLEGRMTPGWWLKADPRWTAGYQVFLDYRKFGGTPALSWGVGGTVGRDWYVPAKAGAAVTVSVDGGIMLGTGSFGAPCSFNPAAINFSEVDMICGGSAGSFPRQVPASYTELPGSFYGFYGGLTGRAMVHWNVKNSGWFLGGGAWGIGQVFVAPGNQMDHQAAVVFTDGTSMEVPYSWGRSLFLRGQLVPGIVVGGRFP